MVKASPIAKAIKYALLTTVSASFLSLPTFAEEAGVEEEVERISVTGSRLKKQEFANAAPVHVITGADAIKTGVRTVAELLQNTSMANGQQMNTSFNSNSGGSNASEPPPTGGVGSSNIGLRGLGAERTLILLNGRRLGASGVRGAPSQPDIGLIPVAMVDRVEIITEGASSIYGADAVAGVINIILKDSFDGFEVSGYISDTEQGGGKTSDFSFITGFEGDKAKFTISGSYYDRERIAVKDRTDCIKKIVRTEAGKKIATCSSRFWDNTVLEFGSPSPTGDFAFFYTPGQTDVGIPNFSSAFGLPDPSSSVIDINTGNQRERREYSPLHQDGVDRMQADLVQPVTRYSLALNGSYMPDWFGGDEEIFYEGYYFHRSVKNTASTEQIFPTAAAMIPHEDANGNLVVNADGSLNLVDNPLSPFPNDASNILTLEDLAQVRNVELNHFRFVTGLRGDFTSEWLENNSWSYEMSASYDRGVGDQNQTVMNETNLTLSLGTLRLDNAGNAICGISAPGGIGFITPNPCVPVDIFAPSVFTGGKYGGGTFATQAERDFLLGTRINTTTVEQAMVSAFMSGDMFEFSSGGIASGSFGMEYRKDTISSAGDMLGSTGLIAAENPLTEGATIGSRNVTDFFGEIGLPILVGQDYAELLEVELALRYTDESNFGDELTQRVRVTYKPTEDLLFSSSYGTSFRAPNLREQFLANQFGGVAGSADPCSVPAHIQTDGAYNASAEDRSATVLANCTATGADYTQIGLNGIPTIPTSASGNVDDLKPETSENITASFKWTPVFDGDFEFDLGITYFSLEVEDTIRQISAQTMLIRCYDSENLSSPFCSRIEREQRGRPDSVNFPSLVDNSFINIGSETSKGVDVNTHFATNFEDVLGLPVHLSWNNQYTLQTERDLTIFKGEDAEDLLGDFGTPEHKLVSTLNLTSGDWNWMIQASYLSGTEADDDTSTTQFCDTGANAAGNYNENNRLVGHPNTANVCSAPAATYVDTSVSYNSDDFSATFGIQNVMDKDAPLVDIAAGSNRGNMVTSSGYDLYGRTFFLTGTVRF